MLSFVVPAHNEELELPGALAAIHAAARASGEPYEIVVVDDASTDATVTIAHAAAARVISIDRRHIAAARNAGAQGAQGDVLVFVDADTHISAAHVAGTIAALQAGSVGGGARIAIDRQIPLAARVIADVMCALYFACKLGAGAFLFTTREHFSTVGGFDERYFAGEEIYFTWALKRLGRFTLLREAVVTSGRKIRMHSTFKLLRRTIAIGLGGPRAVMSREKLDLWYDGQRERPLP